MEKLSVDTDWSLCCRLCKKSFIKSQAAVSSAGLIICPFCREWSGKETKKLKPTRCGLFTEDQDRFIGEIWAWVAINPKTTLEGLCGVVLDGVAHRAMADTFDGAMKFLPFVHKAKELSGKKFKLVRFVTSKSVVELP